VRVEIVLLDLGHAHAAGIAILFFPQLVGLDDLFDVLVAKDVLAFAFLEVLGGVDEEDVVRLLALLQHEDADRNARGVEEIRGQADDGVNVAVLEQLSADAFLGAATKEHAVRQDDGHDALILEEMKAVQEEGEVGGGFGRESRGF
jgi:hypothetical protein